MALMSSRFWSISSVMLSNSSLIVEQLLGGVGLSLSPCGDGDPMGWWIFCWVCWEFLSGALGFLLGIFVSSAGRHHPPNLSPHYQWHGSLCPCALLDLTMLLSLQVTPREGCHCLHVPGHSLMPCLTEGAPSAHTKEPHRCTPLPQSQPNPHTAPGDLHLLSCLPLPPVLFPTSCCRKIPASNAICGGRRCPRLPSICSAANSICQGKRTEHGDGVGKRRALPGPPASPLGSAACSGRWLWPCRAQGCSHPPHKAAIPMESPAGSGHRAQRGCSACFGSALESPFQGLNSLCAEPAINNLQPRLQNGTVSWGIAAEKSKNVRTCTKDAVRQRRRCRGKRLTMEAAGSRNVF